MAFFCLIRPLSSPKGLQENQPNLVIISFDVGCFGISGMPANGNDRVKFFISLEKIVLRFVSTN